MVFRYHPETGLKILDPEPEIPPIIEEYDIAIKNSLIGAGIQANDDDINQDGIPDSLSDIIDPSTNIIGTQDAPIDPMLAAATTAQNGQTILTPLPDRPGHRRRRTIHFSKGRIRRHRALLTANWSTT